MMKSRNLNLLFAFILWSFGVLINPNVLGTTFFGITSATAPIEVYFWSFSLLLILVGLLLVLRTPGVLRSSILFLLMGLLTMMVIESACSLTFRVWKGHWSHLDKINPNHNLYEHHPYLIATPKPNATLTSENIDYSHNSNGYRGSTFPSDKPEEKTRVVAIGGSTTYGIGVNNDETWPYQLNTVLGEDFEVLNLGVPGYSSTENLIQTALLLSEFDPDIAVFQLGLNDLRNMNVGNLRADYSGYHASTLYGALGQCQAETRPALASARLLVLLLQHSGVIESCPNQDVRVEVRKHEGVDQRAISIYERNVKNIIALCETQQIKTLLVPQVLLEEMLKDGGLHWWVRYVPAKEVDDMMDAYNEVLRAVADSSETPFASEVLDHHWQTADFTDPSHFNGRANRVLAGFLARKVLTIVEHDTLAAQEVGE